MFVRIAVSVLLASLSLGCRHSTNTVSNLCGPLCVTCDDYDEKCLSQREASVCTTCDDYDRKCSPASCIFVTSEFDNYESKCPPDTCCSPR